MLRASTIELIQLTIRTKIVYLCLVGGERRGVGSNARAALARAPRHFVRIACGPSIHKVVHFCSLLLCMLTTELAIDDMATYYSQ
jgi:hypothetical protein